MRVRESFLKYSGYILLITLVYAISTARGVLPTFFGTKPLILIPLVLCIAMFEGDLCGATMGAVAGALMDAGSMSAFGFSAIFLLAFGFAAGFLITYFMRNNIFTALIICAGSAFLYGFFKWFFFYAIFRYDNAFYVLCRYYLPSAVYTLVFMPLFYFISILLVKRARRLEQL